MRTQGMTKYSLVVSKWERGSTNAHVSVNISSLLIESQLHVQCIYVPQLRIVEHQTLS